MELEFTPDQDELRDSIRAVLAKECPISFVRAVVEGAADASGFWATTAGLGWPALTVPEDHGGIGLGPVELAILAEELGRVVAPGPLLATVSQFVPVAAVLAGHGDLLEAVAAGELRATLAIAEQGGSFDPADVRTTAATDGAGATVVGQKRFVMAGDDVDMIAVVARDGDGGYVVAMVERADVDAQRVPTLDATRALVDLRLDGARVAADRVFAIDERDLQRALAEATVALALETVGTAQSIFDITLEYAKQREQFGVPIGSFQAVKHKFADMAIALERARGTAYFAALTLAEEDERWTTATSVAKVAAGDCQRLLVKEGIQLHGGIGYTWEHDMHLYAKRAKAAEPMFGTSAWHRARIADQLLAAR
jgi:alkylation response protein AidB-like acyl-CoA dehydrogenase